MADRRTGVQVRWWSRRLGMRLACFPIAMAALISSVRADGPEVEAKRSNEQLQKQLDGEIAALTARIDKSPDQVDNYSRRGDAYFFSGKFAKAVADYEKMVELDPE